MTKKTPKNIDTAKVIHRMMNDTQLILGQLEEARLILRFSLWKLDFHATKHA